MAIKSIYLTRHAQAEHNVAEDYSIPDAPLTKLGREQSVKLNKDTKDSIQQEAELLVISPLRRPLQTALGGYPSLLRRLNSSSPSGVVILPQLQEVNSLPCDTGSPKEALEADPEFAGLNFDLLTPDWTSKQGIYDPANVAERAKWVRRWLRDRNEDRIVVVAHGDILRRITRWDVTPWANAEVREYTFAEAGDEEAVLVPAERDPTVAKEGQREPTSSEQ